MEKSITQIQNDILYAVVMDKTQELFKIALNQYKENVSKDTVDISMLFEIYNEVFRQYKELNQFVYSTRYFAKIKQFSKLNFKQLKEQAIIKELKEDYKEYFDEVK